MKKWHLNRLIGAVEHTRRSDPQKRFGSKYKLSNNMVAEETGLSVRIIHELASNKRATLDLDIAEILISWATANTGIEMGIGDFIEIIPEPWDAIPESAKEWSNRHPLEKSIGQGGRGGQVELVEARIEEARKHFGLG